jgi:hypothetical protein
MYTQFDADISGDKLKKIPHILTYKKKVVHKILIFTLFLIYIIILTW